MASKRLSGNGPHLAWKGEPLGFSRVAIGALDLRRGSQVPALGAFGQSNPYASCSAPLGIPLPSMPGPTISCGVGAGT